MFYECSFDFESNVPEPSFVRRYVDFHCGSNATQQENDNPLPVDMRFSGEADCIYCSGFLSYKYIGRYSVEASGDGNYTLRVENITMLDAGTYTCIDDAGLGPDVASADLKLIGKNDKSNSIAMSHTHKFCCYFTFTVVHC